MTSTRTLLLGTVGIYQPVHGYQVRRELIRWHADEWAHLNPGSVYNGLQKLASEGLTATVDTDAVGPGPTRTSYRLTSSGHAEFLALLRSGLSVPVPHRPDVLHASLCFIWALSREEIIPLLERRAETIETQRQTASAELDSVLLDPGRPDHVAELINVREMRLDGELAWTHSLIERVQQGAYVFAGETGGPWYVPTQAPEPAANTSVKPPDHPLSTQPQTGAA